MAATFFVLFFQISDIWYLEILGISNKVALNIFFLLLLNNFTSNKVNVKMYKILI